MWTLELNVKNFIWNGCGIFNSIVGNPSAKTYFMFTHESWIEFLFRLLLGNFVVNVYCLWNRYVANPEREFVTFNNIFNFYFLLLENDQSYWWAHIYTLYALCVPFFYAKSIIGVKIMEFQFNSMPYRMCPQTVTLNNIIRTKSHIQKKKKNGWECNTLWLKWFCITSWVISINKGYIKHTDISK